MTTQDLATLRRMAELMASPNDGDAVMGLRAVQAALQAEGISWPEAMAFLFAERAALRPQPQPEGAAPAPSSVAAPVAVAGMPQCVAQDSGVAVAMPDGAREVMVLPGAAAAQAAMIAESLTDALVAAVINKSRFKLKVVDVKNAKGEVVETTLRAEYERSGMTPVVVWSHTRGEVAALAAVLRKGLAVAAPAVLAA